VAIANGGTTRTLGGARFGKHRRVRRSLAKNAKNAKEDRRQEFGRLGIWESTMPLLSSLAFLAILAREFFSSL
jgi:hypothetical protein